MTLSVVMVTYNHCNFIKSAVESVLMQHVEFSVELIIADDNSKDQTTVVIDKLMKDHPNGHWIRYHRHPSNLGIKKNVLWALSAATGKYIALCDGDDYWTDSYKLQKQVDFLEYNANFALTCSDYVRKFELEMAPIKKKGWSKKDRLNKDGFSFSLQDLPKGWITKTLTVCFRNNPTILRDIEKYEYLRDVHIIYHLLKLGKGYYFKQTFGVYNLHVGGTHSLKSKVANTTAARLYYKELFEFNKDEVTRQLYFINTVGLIRSLKMYREQDTEHTTRELFLEAFKLIRNPREAGVLFLALTS